MRIGLVIYGSLEMLSGGYLYDRKLVEYLRSQGDTVEVFSQPWHSYPRHLGQNLSRSFEDALARSGVDVLLQDELNHPSLFWLNRRLRRRVRFPFVSIVHHLRSSEAHPRLHQRLYRAVEREYLRSVDGYILNSQTTRQAVEHMLGRKVEGVVAFPGGDRFGEGLSSASVALRAGRNGPLRLLFVGNLIPRKGFRTLLHALGRLPKGGWLLHVVGRRDVEPGYARWMEDLIEELNLREQVIFLGPLRDVHLLDEWKRCHVLVVPSQYEGFGIVYLEGMGFGVPAIASTAGAAGEIIRDGENGFLVPPEDDVLLAERIQKLVDDRELLARMSSAALERFRTFPTWQESAGRIREYLLRKAS